MNIQHQYSLRDHNSFGFDVRAEHYARIDSLEALHEALAEARRQRWPVMPLGGGSNLLLTRDLPGLVLQMALPGIETVADNGDQVLLRIGAGESWHNLVERSIAQGLRGLENLALIPGTAGAAPIQNIGAYGVELVDVFDSLEVVELATGERAEFSRDDCRFSYRDSAFKRELAGRFAITSIQLQLSRSASLNIGYGALHNELERAGIDAPSGRDVADAVIRVRRSKLPDPTELGNAGSFFQNPVVSAGQFATLSRAHPSLPNYPQADGSIKLAAGWLVEQAGWKGYREGTIGVHQQQAIVLVHHHRDGAQGTGAQVLALAQRIAADVRARFGVELEIEPRVI